MQRYARKKETGQDIRRDSNAMCCFLSYVIDCIKNVAQETCGDQGSSVASYIHKTAMVINCLQLLLLNDSLFASFD